MCGLSERRLGALAHPEAQSVIKSRPVRHVSQTATVGASFFRWKLKFLWLLSENRQTLEKVNTV